MRSFILLLSAGFVQSAVHVKNHIRQAEAVLDSPADFELFSKYSVAAYCKTSFDKTANTAVCSTNAQGSPCVGFENTTTVKEFANDAFGKIAGYIAANPGKEHIAVVLKGTDPTNLVDIKTDITKNMVTSELCTGCEVHNGFNEALNSVKKDIEQTVRDELKKTGQEKYRVVVTGHSLGGAVATLAGAYLRKQGIACDIYTYGSPRVGNKKLAEFISSQPGLTARITNRQDIVTAVPITAINPLKFYVHTFPEYWYENGIGSNGDYTSARKVCRSESECTSASCGGKPLQGFCKVPHHSEYTIRAFSPCGGRDSRELVEKLPSEQEFQKFLDEQIQQSKAEISEN